MTPGQAGRIDRDVRDSAGARVAASRIQRVEPNALFEVDDAQGAEDRSDDSESGVGIDGQFDGIEVLDCGGNDATRIRLPDSNRALVSEYDARAVR
jgi:hypothetical protein